MTIIPLGNVPDVLVAFLEQLKMLIINKKLNCKISYPGNTIVARFIFNTFKMPFTGG